MLNACGKTWINENNIVERLPFPDMTCRGTQCKSDSELWLINAVCIENLTELISSQCSNISHTKKPDSWFLPAKQAKKYLW